MKRTDSRSATHFAPNRGTLRVATARRTLALWLVFNTWSCKPADEGPRRETAPQLADQDVVATPPAALPPLDPPAVPPAFVAPAEPSEPVDVTDENASEPATDAELAAILRAHTPEQEKEARDLNAAGLRRHRRHDLEGAAREYTAALVAWPGHVLARYNLACASSLLGRDAEALAELGRLARMEAAGVDIQQSLAKARNDADFDRVRKSETFREITGYTQIIVLWPSGDVSAENRARSAADTLKANHWPVRLESLGPDDPAIREASTADSDRPLLRVPQRDAVANRVAPTIANLVRARATSLRADMDVEIRVIFATPNNANVDPEAAGVVALAGDDGPVDDVALSEWMGPRLTARVDDRTHQLQLKATGFFDWKIIAADGRSETRQGRYRAGPTSLDLEYRQTVETPATTDGAGELVVNEGLRSSHVVRPTRAYLVVDDLRFVR